MLRNRRGTSVYLVCDEDTFLAESPGGAAVALADSAPTVLRSARPRRWAYVLIAALAGAAAINLRASSVVHERGHPPALSHPRQSTGHERRDSARPRISGLLARSASRPTLARDRGRLTKHRHARRVRERG